MDNADAESVLSGCVKRAYFDYRNATKFFALTSRQLAQDQNIYLGIASTNVGLVRHSTCVARCRLGLDRCDAGAHACAIHLQVLHDALNVVARLRD